MKNSVCSGAQLQCSFGTLPAPLVVISKGVAHGGALALATVMDNVPLTNITPFGGCLSPANPQAAAAAAGGPPPACVPQTSAPWSVTSPTNSIAGAPNLTSDATLSCAYAGIITIASAGQMTITVPR